MEHITDASSCPQRTSGDTARAINRSESPRPVVLTGAWLWRGLALPHCTRSGRRRRAMRGGHDGQEEGGVRCGAVTTDRRRAGKGRPCDLWRCLASLGVTVPQLLGTRWGPLQSNQQSAGTAGLREKVSRPGHLSGPRGNTLAVLLMRARQDVRAQGGVPARACIRLQPACCPAAGLVAREAGALRARGLHPCLHAQLGPTPLCWPRHPWLGKASSYHSHLQGSAVSEAGPPGATRHLPAHQHIVTLHPVRPTLLKPPPPT